VLVSAALLPWRDDIRTSNVSLALVLVVLGAAVVGGRLSGALAALVSVAGFDFFFTHPFSSFAIEGRDDVETAVLLLVVGVVVGELVVRTRRSEQVAVESRAEVVRVRRLSELAAGGEPVGRLIGIVQGELATLLQLRGCRFEPPPFERGPAELTHQGVRVPSVPAERPGAEEAGRAVLPVWGEGREVGRFVLELADGTTGITLPPEDRALALALADQLGTVLAAHASDH
jgi:hypothetical protein